MPEIAILGPRICQRSCAVRVVNMRESGKTVPEERKQDDLNQAKKLIEEVAPGAAVNLSDPIRFGAEGGRRPRVLRVNVGCEEKKIQILRNSRKINEGVLEKEKMIYFNADLTRQEREQQKKLREELRVLREEKGETNWVINYREMKLVQRKKPYTAFAAGSDALRKSE